MNSLIFLTEKTYRKVKSRTCSGGRIKRALTYQKDVKSPTETIDSVLLTGVVDVKEEINVTKIDITNAFYKQKLVQTQDRSRSLS